MKTLVLLFLLPIFVQPWAQSHIVFSPISSTHGLSENRVRTICQLADGRMVIVTEGLVNIYDGASFEYMHYNEQKAYHLRDYSGYHRAYVDNEHRLWIKNRHQVMLFDFRAARFEPAIDSVFAAQGINSNIVDLFMDSDFNFWYVLENKTLLLRENSTRNTRTFIHNVQKVSLSPNDRLYDLAIRDNQLFLFFQSGEMVCYNIETAQELYRETTLHEPLNRYSNTLMVVPHKQFLYQARSGNNTGLLVRFNTLNRKWERLLETDYWLNTLTVDNLGNCWIGSFAGLWKIDGALMKKQLVSPLHLVDGRVFNCEISTQFNDSQGGLWLGTVNRGMLYYHPNRFKFRNFGPSMFNVDNNNTVYVNSLIGYDDGILIGTSSGLYQFANNRQELILTNRVPATTNCRMMLKDSRNRLWICAQSNELYCIDGQRTRYYKTTEQCNFLFETFDGRMIVCTNSGPGIFDTTNGHIEKARPTSANTLGNTFQLVEYRQDTLLGYSTNGLFFYDINNNTVSFPKKDSPLLHHNNQHYHCLFTDSRGLIWIGTGDGLNVFDTKKQSTQSFHHKDGLVNNSIRSIIEDHVGRIWISTSNGISCIEQSSTESAYRFTNYNHLDGVIENEFLPQSVTKTNDGRLLWGGLDGFNELDLTQLGSSTPQLSIPLFSRFFLSGTEIKMGKVYDGNIILKQSITTTQEIRLKHHQNFFSVEFSALNYVNPAQTHYRYLLEGVDTYWRETTTRDGIGRSNYTNLSPGTYRLKVQATTNNQQWDQRFAQLTIVIVPPFWKTMWAYAAYFMVIFAIGYWAVSYFHQQNRKKTQKRQKEELDQLKFKFFTNISHELRTPLTLIITPLDSIIKKLDDLPLKAQLSGISRNANELLDLVNQLLAFRKLEMNGESLNLAYCNLGEFMETVVPSFNHLAVEHEVTFDYMRPAFDIILYVDQDKLRKIVNNLLSNAFKFTPRHGRIQVILTKDEAQQCVHIWVSDTGCGIDKNDITQVFDRFYQAKNSKTQTGSGIGLHLVKEYAQLHNGSVAVESQLNKGTVFTITLPANLKPQNRYDATIGQSGNDKTLKIVVVDDHAEFRTFLFNELSEKYNVILATNGKEGLHKIHEEQPDLIISDVMMPIMTGTELCHRVKTDLQISHIPVILLTAKVSDEAQIEGFEAGADAYIAKPFNMEILLLRIENILEQQIKRKELFKQSLVITPASIATSSVDEQLIKKTLEHIEANMDNASYSVEQLSKDMCMDRTGLYRKLTAITGQTPSEFMRAVRLKRAAQLLQLGQSVSDVAERVGFGSLSYFTKCFHDEFGVKPSHYKDSSKRT